MKPMQYNDNLAEQNIDRLVLCAMRRGLKMMPSLDPNEIKMGALTAKGMVRLLIIKSTDNPFGNFCVNLCYDADKGGNFSRIPFDIYENNKDLVEVDKFFSVFDKDRENFGDKVLETVI